MSGVATEPTYFCCFGYLYLMLIELGQASCYTCPRTRHVKDDRSRAFFASFCPKDRICRFSWSWLWVTDASKLPEDRTKNRVCNNQKITSTSDWKHLAYGWRSWRQANALVLAYLWPLPRTRLPSRFWNIKNLTEKILKEWRPSLTISFVIYRTSLRIQVHPKFNGPFGWPIQD